MPDFPAASLATWDLFEEELAELKVSSAAPFGPAIGFLARKHISRSADALLLATISFCVNFDEVIGINTENTLISSCQRYKTVAALAADISALPLQKRECRSLVQHWKDTEDTIFN